MLLLFNHAIAQFNYDHIREQVYVLSLQTRQAAGWDSVESG